MRYRLFIFLFLFISPLFAADVEEVIFKTNAGNYDDTINIDTDASDNLEFTDPVAGTIELDDLAKTSGDTLSGTFTITGQLNVDNLRLDGNALSATSGALDFHTSSTERLTMEAAGNIIFNDVSNDIDVIFESDASTDTLFIDGGDDAVGIKLNPSGTYDLEADGDIFTDGDIFAARLRADNDSNTNIDMNDGDQIIFTAGALNLLSIIESTADEVVVNDTGSTVTFRVETPANINAFLVQGSPNEVEIGSKLVYNMAYWNISAASDSLTSAKTYYQITLTTNTTLTSTPTIVDGTQAGQLLILHNMDGNGDTITLQDETALGSSNLRLPGAANKTLGQYDTLMLIWSGSDWTSIPTDN